MSSDPLASATLAQLYLEQGHLDRARRVLDEVLERDPFDGSALVMRDRLRAVRTGQITSARDGLDVVIKWRGIAADASTELRVLVTGGGKSRQLNVPCRTAVGEHRVRAASAVGACAVAIGHPGESDDFVPQAVAEALEWPAPAGA